MKGLFLGFALVIVAITLVSLITIQKSMISYYGGKLAIETRIDNMNNFYEAILIDSGKALDIISKRAISVAISYVVTKGQGLDRADFRLEELILNGTLNSTPEGLMEDSTFLDWMGKIEDIGTLNGFDTNITVQRIEVKPFDSFNLVISAEIYVNITDQQNIASLKKNTIINQIVSIEGFEDPIYPINTFGRATNIITKSPYWNNFTSKLIEATGNNSWFYGISVIIPSSNPVQIQNVQNKEQKVLITDNAVGIETVVNNFGAVICEADITSVISITYVDNAINGMSILPNNTNILVDGDEGKVWFIENIKKDIQGSYYHPSKNGASFLDRIEGKIEIQSKYQSQTSEIIGLESFVDKSYFATLDVPIDEGKTNVDHLYFSTLSYPGRKVKGLGDFRIDEELCTDDKSHAEIYGISDLLI